METFVIWSQFSKTIQMENFNLPKDLSYNRGLIENPKTYLKDAGCASWLFLVGEEFSKMQGGISYDQVKEATVHSANVVSDPGRLRKRYATR